MIKFLNTSKILFEKTFKVFIKIKHVIIILDFIYLQSAYVIFNI